MSNFKWIQKSRLSLFGFGTLGVLTGIIAVNVLTEPSGPEFTTDVEVTTDNESPSAASAPEKKPTISPVAIEMANDGLNWAHRQSLQRLPESFEPIEELFANARTREFAEKCLGWESKWLVVKDKIFDSSEHAELIESGFRSLIFEEEELERLLEQCATVYLQQLRDIDNTFLVRISADWGELPTGAIPGLDAINLKSQYDDALHRAIVSATSGARAAVRTEALSWAASEAIEFALIRLGVSTGIIGAGGASTLTTFGLGLVVGILLDLAIDEFTDPVGELTFDLNFRLEELRDAILFGTDEEPGLLRRMGQYAGARALARRDAIQEIIFGSPAGATSGSAAN